MKTIKQIKAGLTSAKWYEEGEDGLRGILFLKNKELRFIFSYDEGWEHASVSLANRCPTWDEMCFIKNFFWNPEDCVIQYHPPESQYKNVHNYCLHLWRPVNIEIPLPPKIFI